METNRPFHRQIFRFVSLNGNCYILIDISPKFIPKGPFSNESAFVQIMACCQTGASHYLNQWWPWSKMPHGILGHNKWTNNRLSIVFADDIVLKWTAGINLTLFIKFLPFITVPGTILVLWLIYYYFQDINNLLVSLVGILHLGDIQFRPVGNNDAAQVTNPQVLAKGEPCFLNFYWCLLFSETLLSNLFINSIFCCD